MLRIAEEALTFDDVLLVPGYSEVLPHEVSLQTQLTRGITLNIPLVSAAMDTVTDAELAIAMAQEGGIGIMHKNMTVEQQAAAVRKVKKFESGVVKDPITVSPDTTVREVVDITMANNISGLPVVDGSDLVGIVTGRDIRFVSSMDTPVREIMTPKEKLVTVNEGASLESVKELLHRHRIEKVLVVNGNFELRGLVTVKDIQKAKDYPFACKDEHGRLRVGAAVSTGGDTEARIAALAEAGVDALVVDTAHGHSRGVIERVRWVKQNFPEVQVIGGNIATGEAAIALADAGADAVKVGIGPGSICTTRIVAGIGNANEFRLGTHFVHIGAAGIAHGCAQTSNQLVHNIAHGALAGHPAFDTFRNQLLNTLAGILEVTVTGALPHGTQGTHATICLVATALEQFHFARSFVSTCQQAANHDTVGTGSNRLGNITGEADTSVGDQRNTTVLQGFSHV